MKIGLLGGSFDPVHLAHIALADEARRALRLDRVQLIPAANPWQRPPLAASAEHRLAMLRLAIAEHPGLEINPVEIQRGGKTYTIDTLKQLAPDADYYWILGADQIANFCSWHRWEEIVSMVHLVVAQRPGSSSHAPDALSERLNALARPLIHLPFEARDVSASDIRRRLALNQPVGGLLNERVIEYIRQHGLYGPPSH